MDFASGFSFESPEWLKGLWALPAIVVFYLFRKRARRLLVPFLPFWERVFAERKRRPSIVRTLISILLQVLAAAAILVALARPYREESRPVPIASVIVVDRSLGTRMTSGGTTLADQAVERGKEVAARAAAEGPVSVAILRSALEPRGNANDVAAARALLDQLPPPSGTRSLADLATLREASDDGTRIFLVTPFAVAETGLAGVTVLAAGAGPLQNGGIRSVAAGAAEGELSVIVDPGGADRTLRLVSGAGDELAAAPVSAAQAGPVRIDVPAVGPRDVTLRLDPPDAFPDDDAAPLALAERGRLRVVLATDVATHALDSALVASSVMDAAASGRVPLAQLGAVAAGFDVAIVVGAPAGTQLAAGRYLLVDALAREAPITASGGAGEARATRKDDGVPWLRALDVEEWRIHRMQDVEAGTGLQVLVEGTRGPLVSRFDRDDVRGIVLSVRPDLAASTLPLLPAFPLMLRGALLELAPRPEAAGPLVHRAGGRIVLSAAEAQAFATEDGAARPLRLARDGGGYELPEEAGRFATGARRITTAWLDHPALPHEPRTGDDAWPAAPRRSERRSFQAEVLLVLLAVLLVEWCSYHFGSTD